MYGVTDGPSWLASGSIVRRVSGCLLGTNESHIKNGGYQCHVADLILIFLHDRSGATLPTGMGDSFATEAFTLLGVGIAVIALRVVARATAVGFRRFQFDDYLMCFAAVCLPVSLPLNLANSTTDYLCTGDCYSIRCWRLVPRTCKQWHD